MIFIDEIEAALHPETICRFLDVLDSIARELGVQVFMTSHSYFVIKKLALIAMDRPGAVSCISLRKGQKPYTCDLSDEMPKNGIISTSIQLYKEEIARGL